MQEGQTLRLKVKTVTPIFIGTGNELKRMDFILDGKVIRVIDQEHFIRSLTRQQRDFFLRWIENRISERRDRKRPSSLSLRGFLSELTRKGEVDRRALLGRSTSYLLPYTYIQRRDGRPNINRIKECVKTPDHRPYIPGSEIKGAIRTSMLIDMLQSDEIFRWFADSIKDLNESLKRERNSREKRKILNQGWKEIEDELLRGSRSEAHYDLMRGVQVGDSLPLPIRALRIEFISLQGSSRRFPLYVETISPNQETEIQITIASAERWMEEVGLSDREEWLSWDRIRRAIYARSKLILEEDERYFRGNTRVGDEIERLKRLNALDSPLLRLGWGQGFTGITLTLPLKMRGESVFEDLRRSLSRAYNQYGRTHPGRFPQTRRLAVDEEGNPRTPLGWVKLMPDGTS